MNGLLAVANILVLCPGILKGGVLLSSSLNLIFSEFLEPCVFQLASDERLTEPSCDLHCLYFELRSMCYPEHLAQARGLVRTV